MTRSPLTHTVTSMDMLRSSSRIICALGPADFGDIARVRHRIHRLATAGPSARIGLRATTTTRKWAYRPDLVCDDVQRIAPITRDGITAALVDLSRSVSQENPLRIRLAGDYLLVDMSHGLSDAALPVELYAFLAHPDDEPPLPSWATARTVHNPLPRAFMGWMLRNPGKVVDVLYGKLRTTAPNALAPAPVEQLRVQWSRSPAVATSTSHPGAPDRLREWRQANVPGVSVTSMLCSAIATALTARGIAVTPSAGFLFDCRRYLRTDDVVLGNFAVGIDFENVDPTSPTAVHSAVGHAIDKGRPLAAGASSAVQYFRTRSAQPPIAATTAPTQVEAELTFSDVGRVPQLDGIAWLDEADNSAFYPLSEPSIPESIVITALTVRGTFHVTASFHDNVFDAQTIQSALDLAMSDPIALLSNQELPR